MKPCPFCAEEIQDAAIKCKHCGEFLNDAGPATASGGKLPWYFGTAVIVIGLLSVGPFALPLVWFHSRLSVAWKAGISVVTVVVTWLLYRASIAMLERLNQQLEMLHLSCL